MGGRVVVFNLTADRDWHDWPTDPSFPIVMQEWVRYLTPHQNGGRQTVVGSALSWPSQPGAVYRVVTPTGGLRTVTAAGKRAEFRDTYRAGFYQVTPVDAAGTEGDGLRWFAVVRRNRESGLDAVNTTTLAASLRELGAKVDAQDGRLGEAKAVEAGGEIWRALAMAGGVFLLVELAFAWWLGRRA